MKDPFSGSMFVWQGAKPVDPAENSTKPFVMDVEKQHLNAIRKAHTANALAGLG